MPDDFFFFDVGSRGMIPAEWFLYGREYGHVRIVGFEPDEAECEKLNQQTDATPFKSEKHYPIVLSMADGIREFYTTRDPACSSLYRPNKAWFAHSYGDPDRVDVVKVTQYQTYSLSSFCNAHVMWPDFIKIDAQGAEAEILKGYGLLETVLGVQVELIVLPLYANLSSNYLAAQEILNAQGFVPWVMKPTYWDIRGRRRLAFYDAVFLNEDMLGDPKMSIIFDVYQLRLL